MTQISNIIMQQKQKIMETVDRVTTRAQAALFGGNRAWKAKQVTLSW